MVCKSQYCYDSEDPPVTLQLTFVGTDGVLLASDQQSNIAAPNGKITTSHLTRKIIIDHDRGLAACWSGYEKISSEMARRILKLDDREVSNQLALGRIAEEVYRDVREQIQSESPYGDIILVDRRNLWQVYLVHSANNNYGAAPYSSWIPSGQDSNPALFFCEKFYQRVPIDSLIPLAAHTILTARLLDPARIKGLEILRCTNKGFEFLSNEQLEIAQQRFEVLDDLIKTHLFSEPKRL